MKKKLLFGAIMLLLAGSLVACGEKSRFDEDTNFNDPSIYDPTEANKEIAAIEGYSADMWADGLKGFQQDVLEFEIDGSKVTFPACASDVVENPSYTDFGYYAYPSGLEDWNRMVDSDTEHCFITIFVDNNSGMELYKGEMASHKLVIEPSNDGNFSMSFMGAQITDTTTAADVIAALGEPEENDDGNLIYYFNKGRIKFYFDDTYENGTLREIRMAVQGWDF